MIHGAAPTHELREEFRREGGLTLREEGVQVALEGRSSLEEILRATHNGDHTIEQEPATERGEVQTQKRGAA